MPAIVDPNKCNADEECINACPTEAIALVENKAVVNEELCSDCAACVDACPTQAITLS
jgi:NAD-dependent dihydropyrimidine dehydrogenase PreA subunit